MVHWLVPMGEILGGTIGEMLGGTIGHTLGGHIGVISILLEHIGIFSPFTQEHIQLAFDTLGISKKVNIDKINLFIFLPHNCIYFTC